MLPRRRLAASAPRPFPFDVGVSLSASSSSSLTGSLHSLLSSCARSSLCPGSFLPREARGNT